MAQTDGKWVYLFEEGDGQDRALLGGKGAGRRSARAGLFNTTLFLH